MYLFPIVSAIISSCHDEALVAGKKSDCVNVITNSHQAMVINTNIVSDDGDERTERNFAAQCFYFAKLRN